MLPYKKAFDLSEQAAELSWLIEGLWCDDAVGILGGEPKCCKSFLALELAVAVSSGQPCLGRYVVKNPGPVLLYAAEDALHIVKSRLSGIAKSRNVDLSTLNIQVITSEKLRLDQDNDIQALNETVGLIKPRLLILDPFVRLHRIDENSSLEVASVLGNLRILQRQYKTSVLIVHHSKKNGNSMRSGQALRGSSEFHAWGDSNLYMKRSNDELILTMEHRSAPSLNEIHLNLIGDGTQLALEIISELDNSPPQKDTRSVFIRIEETLKLSDAPMTLAILRQKIGLRTSTIANSVKEMVDDGRIYKSESGYALKSN